MDGFFLEYDSDRAGGTEPLRYIGKQVVLGLVTSQDAKLENKEDVILRIREASQYVPLEQLALSPAVRLRFPPRKAIFVTDADQWSKLALVKEIAEEVWAD